MRQRAFDLALCVVALPFLALLGVVVAAGVWLDSPGPILYRSMRVGRGGRPFLMLKFRTMKHGEPGPPISSADDDRYTPLGAWLARHRLDELPQIVNILRGEMRLVGPRPEIGEFVDAYPDEFSRILSVLPGVTGPAQLQFADEGRLLAGAADRAAVYRETILPSKLELDLGYIERPTLRRDVTVLLRTLVLPAQRLRRWTVLTPAVATTAGPGTRALVALSLLALALTGLFGMDAASA